MHSIKVSELGWRFRFEWQLANDQLVELIWCQTFPADDPNNDENENPDNYDAWFDSTSENDEH